MKEAIDNYIDSKFNKKLLINKTLKNKFNNLNEFLDYLYFEKLIISSDSIDGVMAEISYSYPESYLSYRSLDLLTFNQETNEFNFLKNNYKMCLIFDDDLKLMKYFINKILLFKSGLCPDIENIEIN
jgi:hypothetical protein